MSSLHVAHGAGEILSSSNAKSTSIDANVRQGVNLRQMTYSAGVHALIPDEGQGAYP